MFDHMCEYRDQAEDCVSFDVSVMGQKGIYIRELSQLRNGESEYSVTISPKFITNRPG